MDSKRDGDAPRTLDVCNHSCKRPNGPFRTTWTRISMRRPASLSENLRWGEGTCTVSWSAILCKIFLADSFKEFRKVH